MTHGTVNARCICTTVQNELGSRHCRLCCLHGELIIHCNIYCRSSTELEVSFEAFIDREFADCHEHLKFTLYATRCSGPTLVSTGVMGVACVMNHTSHTHAGGTFFELVFLSKHTLALDSIQKNIFIYSFKIDCLLDCTALIIDH